MANNRPLTPEETALARSVFSGKIVYGNVNISDRAIGNTAVTIATPNVLGAHFDYYICWPEGYAAIIGRRDFEETFIHEMTHVWQGNNGVFPPAYMGQSILSQVEEGIKDIIRKKKYVKWDEHRAGTYTFKASDVGKDWTAFNVEQQAYIVESWYSSANRTFGPGIPGGQMSQNDRRFPYIRDVIRTGRQKAKYAAPQPTQAAPAGSGLAAGGDAAIKQAQDKLVALGYLEAKNADGLVGRTKSATLDAVERFQRRNGMKPDRVLGGPNSETRRKLMLPVEKLVRAQ